jgi:hypothetical protein
VSAPWHIFLQVSGVVFWLLFVSVAFALLLGRLFGGVQDEEPASMEELLTDAEHERFLESFRRDERLGR